jgi:hypothetical protein
MKERGPKPRRAARAFALATLALIVAAFGLSSCATDLDAVAVSACPDQAVFETSVSPFLERRCGTLDCHGSMMRPMRIYGRYGLRHPDEGNIPGGKATTKTELEANYSAVCNLQPEKMTASVQDLGNDAENLLFVQKARNEIKHKGGKVVSGDGNDPGDLCIVKWLQLGKGEVETSCEAALERLNP